MIYIRIAHAKAALVSAGLLRAILWSQWRGTQLGRQPVILTSLQDRRATRYRRQQSGSEHSRGDAG